MLTIDIPVLIVGGGGAGLTASNILADLGIGSLLVERHPQTSHLPKAHYLNQRSMEIFRRLDLADAIYARGAPPDNMGKITWHTSLGGDGPLDRIVIKEVDAMGGGRYAAEHALKGPTRAVNIPQLRLEPILREHAERRNPGKVLFRHEFQSFRDVHDGVEAIVHDLDGERDILVRAKYIIAADAGKTLAPQLGIGVTGPSKLGDYVMAYIRADLSHYIPDDRSVMRVIVKLDQSAGKQPVGGLLALGPNHWDRHSEEWGIGWGYAADDPDRNNHDNMERRIQEFLKVDVPIEVKLVSHWYLEAVVADRFRDGRIFLVGDAAHRHTPGGGLGLNSAIQDVDNLCWKLALVLGGQASEDLLDSYEIERRPVVTRNAENSLTAFANHFMLMSAMGITPGASREQNEASFAQMLIDTPDGRQRHARLDRVFDAVIGSEYAPHDLEMGFQYRGGAIVDDDTPWPARDPMGSHYVPSTHPGCRLPHVWLHGPSGAVSTHDLIPNGGFLLLTGTSGDAWRAAAQKVAAERGVPVRVYSVGDGGDLGDPSNGWALASELADDGALLVRPDAHIGYRAMTAPSGIEHALRDAVSTILAPRLTVSMSDDMASGLTREGAGLDAIA